jgi:flagellar hook-length control protein FliK
MMPTVPTTATVANAPVAATNGPGQSAAPTDFLTMLSQLAQQPVDCALAPLFVADDGALSEDELLDPTELEALGLMPLSLPMFNARSQFDLTVLQQQGALGGVQLLTGKGAMPGLDPQALADMIESEQALVREADQGLENFRLPANLETAQPAKVMAQDPVSRLVQQPVGSQAWADELGARLTMMAEGGRSTASLRMSPEHLGPLEIRIAVRDDQASVWFGAAHSDTRAAIEHALPRLRELFEAQGMSLADAGVFQQAPREQPATPQVQASGGDSGQLATNEAAPAAAVTLGLLDTYA